MIKNLNFILNLSHFSYKKKKKSNKMLFLSFNFLFLFSSSKLLSLKEGDFGSVKFMLDNNDEFIIESKHQFLCIVFQKTKGLNLSVYSDNNEIDLSLFPGKLAGIDFGHTLGKIVFKKINGMKHDFNDKKTKFNYHKDNFSRFAKVKLSYLVFPKKCGYHRLISSLPNELVEFSSNSQNPDYLIYENQHFCFWPASSSAHYLTVNMSSEKNFDLLVLMKPVGMVNCFTGNDNDVIYSTDGLEYFIWQTDHIGPSQYFSIKVTNVEKPTNPVFNRMLHGRDAAEVQFFYEYNGNHDFKPQPTPPFHKKPKDRKIVPILLPFFSGVTIIMIIFTIIAVIWCKRTLQQYKDEIAIIPSPSSDKYFKATSSKELPQPIFL